MCHVGTLTFIRRKTYETGFFGEFGHWFQSVVTTRNQIRPEYMRTKHK